MKPLNLDPDAPWRQRFRSASIAWAEVASQNQARGLVCTNKDGIFQLYAWEVPTGNLKQLTFEHAGVVFGAISAKGDLVYFFKDEGGNEIGHFVRIPFEGGETQDLTPDLPPYSSFTFSQSHTGNILGFIGANKDGFTACAIQSGTVKSFYHTPNLCNGLDFSANGDIAVIGSTDRTKSIDTSLLVFDINRGTQIAELWDGEGSSVGDIRFSPVVGDTRLLATTSKSGFERPLLWNPITNERKDLVLEEVPGSISVWDWSPDAKRVLLLQLYQAQYQLYVYELESNKVTKLNHPDGVLGGYSRGFFAGDNEIWVTWQNAFKPARLVTLDVNTGELKETLLSAGEPPEGSDMRSFTINSENGDTIQGWVAVPEGNGPFPTILHTHGGPTSVQTKTFSPSAQTWLDHGFAFCSVNYHGSVTFGKIFEKSIWGNLGDLEVQDMAAAYRWLVENGIAKPDSVLLTGGSYGGYLTLQAIGRRPDLWAGGMAVVAIADWKLLYEDEAETLRGYQRALFGGSPDETPEATKKSSPSTYAKQIKAPLFVIQGENDTRCPARQMKVYEETLKSLGKAVTVHWFDAGHGSRAQEQQIEQQEMMLRFAYQVLG
jgi:dipeptidyl aminopeptidase/acylaminoacyl peptidase